jgi:hypothetical protein
MSERYAICWGNGIGRPEHEWQWTPYGVFCRHCGGSKINFEGFETMFLEKDQEGQLPSPGATRHVKEGENA